MDQANGTGNAELWAAYTRAWHEIGHVTKNAHNPHFGSNYADLAAVMDTYKPVFEKHGLALYQGPGRLLEIGGKLAIGIVNILTHTSGQTFALETQMPLGEKPTAQSAVAATTYGRRCAGAGIAGIAQVDDDGNEASGRGEQRRSRRDAAQADDLKAAIAAFQGTPEELEGALAKAVQDLNDEGVADAYKAKRRELRGKKK